MHFRSKLHKKIIKGNTFLFQTISYLPYMLMCKVSPTVSTSMQSSSGVNIFVLSHVVGSGIMFATNCTNEPLLTT